MIVAHIVASDRDKINLEIKKVKPEIFITTSKLSALVYEDPADIEAELKNMGLENFDWIENEDTDTQSFMCNDPVHAFYTIRGTEFDNLDDHKTNCNFKKVECDFGHIHQGFYLDALSVYHDAMQAFTKHNFHNRKLIINGHSQGGGVANAFTTELLSKWVFLNVLCITFGCPRTLDRGAANYINAHFPGVFHRFVNNNDIVTRIVPRLFNFKHIGQLHYFDHDGNYTTDISAWAMFLDRVKGKAGDFGDLGLDAFKDHPSAEYAALVNKKFTMVPAGSGFPGGPK